MFAVSDVAESKLNSFKSKMFHITDNNNDIGEMIKTLQRDRDHAKRTHEYSNYG